jgi:TolA-binding protein
MSETQVTTEGQSVDTDDLAAFSDEFFGQNKSEGEPETKLPAEQEVKDKPVVETEAQKVDDDNEQDEEELKEEIPQEAPKRKTVQDRIDEVVRQREELRRESQAELQAMRAEIEALKKGPTADTTVAEAAEPQPDAVDKDGNPIYGLGEFDPQYIRDLTRFTLNQERAKVQAETVEAQKQAVATQEQQALQATWNGKMEAATQEFPDFIEKGQALLNGFNTLDPNYAGYLSNVLMSMDKGPEVLYYLSNHPDEAAQIVSSGAQKATLALGRIESRFLQSEQEAPKQKFTKAPAPPAVRTRGTNGAFVAVAPDTDDLDAFQSEFFRKA